MGEVKCLANIRNLGNVRTCGRSLLNAIWDENFEKMQFDCLHHYN